MLWSAILAASCFGVLALAHSALGEKEILAPLFRAEWETPTPRWAVQRILRFAWHLTSIAWIGLGAAALGAPVGLCIAGVGLSSGAVVFFTLRGHLAWPLFTLAGLAGLALHGWLLPPLLAAGVGAAVLTLLAVAGLHLYWVAGGRWGLEAAIPSSSAGTPLFTPPPWATLAVALALLGFGALILWTYMGAPPPVSRLVGAGAAVMVLRAVGDGKQVGLSKTQRASLFAKWDDRLFTPLALLMAGGAGAALLA